MNRIRSPFGPLGSVLLVAVLFLHPASLQAQSADAAAPMPPAAAPTPTLFDQPGLVERYQQTITPQDLAAHLYLFASDLFEGRETATRGQKLAAHYLAAQYRKMGLTPKGTMAASSPYAPEAYFQPFPVYGQRLAEARLQFIVGGDTVATSRFSPTRHDDQAYLAFGNLPESSGEVVFAGYGIADDELGYDDYAALEGKRLDVAGKWVLMLGDEPLANDSTSLLPTPNKGVSKWATQPFAKLSTLVEQGMPKGVLIVADLGSSAKGTMAERAARAAASQQQVGSLSLSPQGPSQPFPPLYAISSNLANKLLAAEGKTIQALKQEIDQTLKPVVFALQGATVTSVLKQETAPMTTENVLAFIEGSDPALKDEVVIISSHYDHIGLGDGGHTGDGEGDTINNGADDDGSGTVTTLEIAEAFMKAKADGYGPRRSLLFLNVTGEEKGLLGSAYYADTEPVLPLRKTVANLNIDMIGRHDPTHPSDDENYVYIIGSNLISQELHDINLRANEMLGLNLELNERFNSKDDPNRFYARSDHWNFGKHGIPFIFFFTGTHEDYHQPGDEADKIDYDRMAHIAQLIFGTAWQVANQDNPPAVSGTGFN